MLFLSLIQCFIHQTTKHNHWREIKELTQGTVILCEYEHLIRKGGSFVQPDIDTKYNLLFKVSSLINDKKKTVVSYKKSEQKDSFFCSAPNTGTYIFELINEIKNDTFLDIKIHEGRSGEPVIVSSADAQIKDVHKKVEIALGYARHVLESQKKDLEEKDEFNSLVKSMLSIIFYSLVLKVVVVLSTLFYFNKNVKKFYISKKIINE